MEDEQTDTDEERDPARLSRRLKTWLGVAASVAGVVAGVLLVVDRWGPKPAFTVEDWAREANAVCDKYVNFEGTLQAWPSVQRLADAPDSLPKDQLESLREEAASNTAELASKLRKIKANLGEIPHPDDHAKEVNRVLASINETSNSIFGISSALHGTISPEEVQYLYALWQLEEQPRGEEQVKLLSEAGRYPVHPGSGPA